VLLNIAQPFPNHNGGQLRFGPDGYLYIGMGDGGSAGDPMNNAQNRNSLLGKLLRIDVESDPGRVRIPPDNPFVNVSGARPEIWAYGLRNPWRFSFDRATGDLFIGDVGQDRWEEIDFTPAASRGGENYGWPAAEGQACFRTNCSMQGTALPAAVYGHQSGDCSVTGGFMYRGPGSPGLRGTYLFADYCTGRMRAMRREGDRWVSSVVLTPGGQITTFGEDEAGEIYVGDAGRRTLYRIEGSAAPRITSALVNPATNAPGVVAGSIARAYGLGLFDTPGEVTAPGPGLPITLEGVSVKVDDIAAPVSRVSSRNGVEQVEFQLPFEAAGRSSVTVVVSRNGAAGAPVNVPLAPVQPGLYEGVGRSEDYTVVTVARPLEPGESAYVRATGLGPVSNPPATGAPATFDPLPVVTGKVELTLAGMPCEVEFAVLAPDLVGIYQINFRAPAGAPSGMQDLVASIGGVSSPPIKVAVR
jgi:uncharacterized protein (TIGR03437 family)